MVCLKVKKRKIVDEVDLPSLIEFSMGENAFMFKDVTESTLILRSRRKEKK